MKTIKKLVTSMLAIHKTMTTKHKIKLTGRQVGIVLAALSKAQQSLKEIDFSQWLEDDKEVTAKEIDFICEEINFG